MIAGRWATGATGDPGKQYGCRGSRRATFVSVGSRPPGGVQRRGRHGGGDWGIVGPARVADRGSHASRRSRPDSYGPIALVYRLLRALRPGRDVHRSVPAAELAPRRADRMVPAPGHAVGAFGRLDGRRPDDHVTTGGGPRHLGRVPCAAVGFVLLCRRCLRGCPLAEGSFLVVTFPAGPYQPKTER